MKPRAWIVQKHGMTGELYSALAWDNDGKPQGVSISTPVPLFDEHELAEQYASVLAANRDCIEHFEAIQRDHKDAQEKVENLSMLVCRLVRRIQGQSPSCILAKDAMKYLAKIGHEHGTLRGLAIEKLDGGKL